MTPLLYTGQFKESFRTNFLTSSYQIITHMAIIVGQMVPLRREPFGANVPLHGGEDETGRAGRGGIAGTGW